MDPIYADAHSTSMPAPAAAGHDRVLRHGGRCLTSTGARPTPRGRLTSRTAARSRPLVRRAYAFAPAALPTEISAPPGYAFGFAEPGEIDGIARLIWGAGAAAARGAAALRRVDRDEHADVVVARRAGMVVGAVIVRARPGDGLHLPKGVRVAPGHEKVGVIRHLLHLALLWCRVTGVETAHAAMRGAVARDHGWIYRSLRGRAVPWPSARPRRVLRWRRRFALDLHHFNRGSHR